MSSTADVQQALLRLLKCVICTEASLQSHMHVCKLTSGTIRVDLHHLICAENLCAILSACC